MKPILIIQAALLMLLQSACTSLFYHPSTVLEITPDALNVEYEEVHITQEGLPALHGWFLPAEGDPAGTILHLHGNAENIANHLPGVYWLPSYGFNVLMIDYQGYGKSQGNPSPMGMEQDAARAFEYLLQREGIDSTKIALFGQSLGAVVALHSAAASLKGRSCAVVAESPFSNYQLIAQEKLEEGWMPSVLAQAMSRLIINTHSPDFVVAHISPTPILIIKSEWDVIVPPHHSQRLYDLARQPKDLWFVPQTGHIEVFTNNANRSRLAEYLAKACSSTRQ